MASIKETLTNIMDLEGVMGTCIVDYSSGMVLGKEGGGVDLDLAAAGNSEVVKAKLKTMKSLGIPGTIQDILITLDSQYHIIRPAANLKNLFLYVVMKKDKANLALCRRKVQSIEEVLEV